jgi:polyhydroxybutyrate depolymerase
MAGTLAKWMGLLPTLGVLSSAAPQQGGMNGSVISWGRRRTYHVHVPPSYDGIHAVPLVIALHGRGGHGRGMITLTHLDRVADREGFIAVFPDGYRRSWADGRGTTPADRAGVDDVVFIARLVDTLSITYRIDSTRVFAMGMSNGGFMAQRLGCDLANVIAAIAPVAAGLGAKLQPVCHPARSVSVIEVQGTDDPLVPYGGGKVRGPAGGLTLGAVATADFWATAAHCPHTPSDSELPDTDPEDGTRVRRMVYATCRDGSRIELLTIVGGGHAWPGGMPYASARLIGRTSRDVDATELIWSFFRGTPVLRRP